MNYLAHLLLAGDEPQAQLGGLLGDFTRGRLERLAKTYPPLVMHGIRVHRKIDHFTDRHESVVRSKKRFSPDYVRFSGIIIDVLHDHFLSQHWDQFTHIPRERFIASSYELLRENHSLLPKRLQDIAPRIIEQDWLGSYLDFDMIDSVYKRLAKRLVRPNPLAEAIVEVESNYSQLETDFILFFPDIQRHALRLNATKGSSIY